VHGHRAQVSDWLVRRRLLCSRCRAVSRSRRRTASSNCCWSIAASFADRISSRPASGRGSLAGWPGVGSWWVPAGAGSRYAASSSPRRQVCRPLTSSPSRMACRMSASDVPYTGTSPGSSSSRWGRAARPVGSASRLSTRLVTQCIVIGGDATPACRPATDPDLMLVLLAALRACMQRCRCPRRGCLRALAVPAEVIRSRRSSACRGVARPPVCPRLRRSPAPRRTRSGRAARR
jgi:hypothetical protein